MRATLAVLLVVLAATVACGAATGSGPSTGLRGIVTRGPLQPVCTVGTPCQGPAAGAKLVFIRNSRVVARTTTRADGSYRVTLRPGRYAVRVGPTRSSAQPSSALVPRRGFRRVDIFVDTGIR